MTNIIRKLALTCITILILSNATAGRQRVLLADASKEVHGSAAERVQDIGASHTAFSAIAFSGKGSTKVVSQIFDTRGELVETLVTNSGFTCEPSSTSVSAVAKQIRKAFPTAGGDDAAAAGAGGGSEGLKPIPTAQVLTEHLRRHSFDFSAYDDEKLLADMQKKGSGDSKEEVIKKRIDKYAQQQKEVGNLYGAIVTASNILKRFVPEEPGSSLPLVEAEVAPVPKIVSEPIASYEVSSLKNLAQLMKATKILGLNVGRERLKEECMAKQALQYQHDAHHAFKAGVSDGAAAVDPEKTEDKEAAKAKLMTCYYGSCAEDALLHKVLHDLSSKPEGSPKILRVEIYGPIDPCHQCQVKLEWLADKLAKQYEETDLRSRVEVCYFSKKGYPQSPCMVRDAAAEEEPLTSSRDELEEGQLMMYRYFAD